VWLSETMRGGIIFHNLNSSIFTTLLLLLL
jgi:hypothetical protein